MIVNRWSLNCITLEGCLFPVSCCGHMKVNKLNTVQLYSRTKIALLQYEALKMVGPGLGSNVKVLSRIRAQKQNMFLSFHEISPALLGNAIFC
jgi:hypothetical protein